MSGLKCAYVNEMYKISKKKKLIVAALLGAATIAALGLIFMALNKLAGVGMMFKGEFGIMILPFFEYSIIPLFTAFIAIDMFSGEFTDETIKITLTKPVSRFKVYISKVLACATFLIGFLFYTMIIAVVVSMFSGITFQSIIKTVTAYLLTFFPLMVFALMVMLVSNFSRGSASAFLISIVIFFLFKGFEIALPIYKSFFFTSAFDWYKLSLGAYFNLSKIFRLFVTLTGYAITFLFAGYYLFDKRAV